MCNRDLAIIYTLPSGAQVATFNSDKIDIARFLEAIVLLDVTVVAGTTPTLDIKAQTSDTGNSADWFDLPSGSFTQKTTVAKDVLKLTNFGKYIRFVYTIGGTTPSFTMRLSVVAKQ